MIYESITRKSRRTRTFCFALVSLLFTLRASADYDTEQNIPYRSADETSSDPYIAERCILDIYYPTEVDDYPTVVWFHGGGLKNGNKSIPERLKNQDIAIVAANYRLSPKVSAPTYIEDAAAAVAWVFKNIESYGGNPKKIFVSGSSAGGYLTFMLGLDKQWLGAHQIDADQVAGYIPLAGQTVTHSTIRGEQGISNKQPIIDKLAPLYHIRGDAPPFLLVTGYRELESIGRYEENSYMWRMLKEVGHTDVRLLELDGYGHAPNEPFFPLLLKEIERLSSDND